MSDGAKRREGGKRRFTFFDSSSQDFEHANLFLGNVIREDDVCSRVETR